METSPGVHVLTQPKHISEGMTVRGHKQEAGRLDVAWGPPIEDRWARVSGQSTVDSQHPVLNTVFSATNNLRSATQTAENKTGQKEPIYQVCVRS